MLNISSIFLLNILTEENISLFFAVWPVEWNLVVTSNVDFCQQINSAEKCKINKGNNNNDCQLEGSLGTIMFFEIF